MRKIYLIPVVLTALLLICSCATGHVQCDAYGSVDNTEIDKA